MCFNINISGFQCKFSKINLKKYSPDLLIGFAAFSILSISDLTDCLLLWRLKTTFCLRVATSSPGKLLGLAGTVVVDVVVSPETTKFPINLCFKRKQEYIICKTSTILNNPKIKTINKHKPCSINEEFHTFINVK